MGSGKSQELFPPAQACGKGAHCLEVMDPMPFDFSSNPLPTPHRAPSSWGRPSEGISQPAVVPQAHALADFLPGTLGERGQCRTAGHAPPEQMPRPQWLEGRRKPRRAASSLGLPQLQGPAWGRGHGRHWGGSGGGGVRTYVWKRETGTGRSHLPPRQGGMWGSRAGSGLGGTEAKCQTAEGASSGPEGASPGTCPGLLPAPLCSAEPVLVWGCLCPHPAPRPQGLHQGRRPAARDPASL